MRERYEGAEAADLESLRSAAKLLEQYPLAFVKTTELARQMTVLFEDWIRMGRLDVDLLNRVGGTSTIRIAREINEMGKGLL